MQTITFSILDRGDQEMRKTLEKLIQEFEERENIEVNLEITPWSRGWSHLLEIALYQNGPDISEVGSSWISDLMLMDAIRPFSDDEAKFVINNQQIFERVFESVRVRDQTKKEHSIYSIPWHSDVRVLYYRKDLLQTAGIDPNSAFSNPRTVEKTLQSLKDKGIKESICLPTLPSHNTIHYLASWIWSSGGDFLSPAGSHITFNQPAALSAIKDYFRLGKYINPEFLQKDEAEVDNLFSAGKVAVLFSGYWVYMYLDEKIKSNLGITMMPGRTPFIGGSNLAIWRHTPNLKTALRLIRFLCGTDIARYIAPNIGLPVSEENWNSEPLLSNPFRDVFLESIKIGRTFPSDRLWGMIEKQLVNLAASIWLEIQENERTLDEIVDNRINALARRLEKIITHS
ncbi:MAG: extracellular solute-binding protein [Anaerolineales bacterium]|nr:extracellular solute-binding protein [Anaerolineales bacterium]